MTVTEARDECVFWLEQMAAVYERIHSALKRKDMEEFKRLNQQHESLHKCLEEAQVRLRKMTKEQTLCHTGAKTT